MTWFSDRSGIASTGIVSIARNPATPSASEARITRKRLRIDHSMIDSIMIPVPFELVPVGAFGRSRRGAGWFRRRGLLGRRRHGAGIDAALGVDQERAARRDLLARREALKDREAVAG